MTEQEAGTRTPGPRRRLSASQRRDQLTAAAVTVLAEQGFRGTTADAIARRAGLSKGLLWHYFDDLDDLLDATARRSLIVLRDAVAATVDLSAPAPELIRAAIHGAAALSTTHRAEQRAIREIVTNLRGADGLPRFGVRDYEELYGAQESLFREGQRAGQLRADLDPRLIAVTYQGAVDGMLAYLDSYPETDPAVHAATVAEILLGGLSTPS